MAGINALFFAPADIGARPWHRPLLHTGHSVSATHKYLDSGYGYKGDNIMAAARKFVDYGTAPSLGRATPIVLAGTDGDYSYKFKADITIEELQRLITDNNLGINIVKEGHDYATCLRSWNLVKAEVHVKVVGAALELSTSDILRSKAGSLGTSMLKDIRAAIMGEVVQQEELANAAGCLFRGGRPEMARKLLKAIGISNPDEVYEIGRIYRATFAGAEGERRALSFARMLISGCVGRMDSGEIMLKIDGNVREAVVQIMGELPNAGECTVQKRTAYESRILQVRRR